MIIGGGYIVYQNPKKFLDLFLFFLFNIMLNGSDVVLDILTAEDLGNPTPVSYQ